MYSPSYPVADFAYAAYAPQSNFAPPPGRGFQHAPMHGASYYPGGSFQQTMPTHHHGGGPMLFATPIQRQRTPNNTTQNASSGNAMHTPSRTVPAAAAAAAVNSSSSWHTSQSTYTHTTKGHAMDHASVGGVNNNSLISSKNNNNMTMVAPSEKSNPMSGRGLERELNMASKEELVQILLDLSSCNADAANFVLTKAQLFGLRAVPSLSTAAREQQQQQQQQSPLPAGHVVHKNETPSKMLFGDDARSLYSGSSSEGTLTAPTSALRGGHQSSPHTPSRLAQQLLHDRHQTPENRPFSSDVHPCLRLYGACRHPTNCIFKSLPRNLCLHWIRGSCTGGADCGCVHRLPSTCPLPVSMVFELSRGSDRSEMGKKVQGLFSPPPPLSEHEAKMAMLPSADVSPVREVDDSSNQCSHSATPCAVDRYSNEAPACALEDGECDSEDGLSAMVQPRCLNDSFDRAIE